MILLRAFLAQLSRFYSGIFLSEIRYGYRLDEDGNHVILVGGHRYEYDSMRWSKDSAVRHAIIISKIRR